MKNQNSNYALVTALYESRTKGLYSDIYFPIIKYAIVKLSARANGQGSQYRQADDLHDIIEELFHISIPNIVIAQTIRKINAQSNSSIELEVLENGNCFKIVNAAYDSNDVSYEEKERDFERCRLEIEFEYKEFIKREGSCDTEVTFLEFIAENTENILGYFENQREEQVDEKYSSMVFFLDYLNREKKELFNVANQLFWSSVIVAFLQSEQPQVNDTMDDLQAEYYLDTAVVTGLLDLSTEENVRRAREVCKMVISAGGQLKVHPITIEEIKGILQSVERDGANPCTGMSFASIRRNLTATDFAKIRLNLQRILEKDHSVNVFPIPNSGIRLDVMRQYKGKDIVRRLAEARRKAAIAEYDPEQDSYTSDSFREIHDIFMDDYVKNLKKAKNGKNNIYFLTTNTELIDFCKSCHPAQSNMISMGQVVLDLWMHNTQPADVSSCALTETMARCMDLHRAKVRSKLNKVARCYNKTKEDFDPQVYKDFLNSLYRRDKNVIAVVEADPEEDPRAFMQKLKDAVRDANEYYQSTNSAIHSEKERLVAEATEREQVVQSLSEESEKKSREIGGLNSRYEEVSAVNSKLESDLKIAEKAIKVAKEEAAKESKEREDAQKLNRLYGRRDELNEKLVQLKATIEPLEMNRNKGFSYGWPKVLLIAGIVVILITGIMLILDKANIYVMMSWEASAVLVAIGGILITSGLALGSEDRKKKLREKYYAQWDTEHPSYPQLKSQIDDTEEELRFVQREIKNSTPQK